jgi:hypothetical protein
MANELTPEEREEFLRLSAKMGRAPAAPPGQEPMPGQRAWGQAPPPNPPQVVRLKPPTEIVRKQIDNLQAVGATNYSAGVATPRKDPIEAAIQGQAAYEAKMRDPNVLRRRVEGLRRTNMQEWGQLAETLGAQRLVEGVTARRFKVERFWGNWHGLLSQHLQRIDSLPSATDADRERRMIENLRGLKNLKGRA